MNRVKAGDAWARVSTKRYGSRLDGNEARIEPLSLSPPRPFPPLCPCPACTRFSLALPLPVPPFSLSLRPLPLVDHRYITGAPLVPFDYPRIMSGRDEGLSSVYPRG